ncbi:MAG: riboflavin synthase [Phycisphaerales bacterium]|jgi:riboflavin synthase
MFTGLIERIGTVISSTLNESGIRLELSCTNWAEVPKDGDSIAVSGCCLTVVNSRLDGELIYIEFDIIAESLACTTLGTCTPGSRVNLELAMRADSRFGGHFVQGHIDGKACVVSIQKMESGEERIRFTTDMIGKDLLVSKGSIAIDGVSLTLASVEREFFEVCLIPMTVQETTFGTIQVGQVVNIETDMLTRTVVQIVTRMST